MTFGLLMRTIDHVDIRWRREMAYKAAWSWRIASSMSEQPDGAEDWFPPGKDLPPGTL